MAGKQTVITNPLIV